MKKVIDLVDKWILEHGSASLSKEAIADLRQKITDSDAAHATEMQELQSTHTKEIARLNKRHADEMANLERMIAELQEPQPPAHLQIADSEEDLIKLMVAGGGRAFLEEMARTLHIPLVRAQYSIDKLKALGFVRNSGAMMGRGDEWALTPPGNAYAVENGLSDDAPLSPPPGGLSRR